MRETEREWNQFRISTILKDEQVKVVDAKNGRTWVFLRATSSHVTSAAAPPPGGQVSASANVSTSTHLSPAHPLHAQRPFSRDVQIKTRVSSSCPTERGLEPEWTEYVRTSRGIHLSAFHISVICLFLWLPYNPFSSILSLNSLSLSLACLVVGERERERERERESESECACAW